MNEWKRSLTGLSRRDLVKHLLVAGSVPLVARRAQSKAYIPRSQKSGQFIVDDFDRPESLNVGANWESLNPGYWKIESRCLRRRLRNYGDHAVPMQFPWDWNLIRANPEMLEEALNRLRRDPRAKELIPETVDLHKMSDELLGRLFPELDYHKDPSLPEGMLWRSDWRMSGNFRVSMQAVIHELTPDPQLGDDTTWQQFAPGYGFVGLCLSGKELTESYNLLGRALVAGWFEDGRFGIFQTQRRRHRYLLRGELDSEKPFSGTDFIQLSPPRRGDRATVCVAVLGQESNRCTIVAEIDLGGKTSRVNCRDVDRQKFGNGFLGISGRGLLDFAIDNVELEPIENRPLAIGHADCLVCYPLGDTLRELDGKWRVRFIGMFRIEGTEAAIRIAEVENPPEGWDRQHVAGTAPILSNAFRRNTAAIDVTLPFNPADKTLYYTVWKDGRNVTADARIGTRSVGPGTGYLGQTPRNGKYVGRLPKLTAPYRICGLSCHRVFDERLATGREAGMEGCELIMDQPWPRAFQHFEAYNFQVLLWEDDAWYLEFPIFPPSTDDCYQAITFHLGGPTQRWQMMRHWNVLNPGDHDYGVDDFQGPEQFAARFKDGLTQNAEYIRRNMQIAAHLMLGDEHPDPAQTPRMWRRWKFPNRDFSLVTVDSRLWKSSPDRRLWALEGWSGDQDALGRQSPHRTILGEEQAAWLDNILRTDSSTMICVSGVNVLNTIYNQLLGGTVSPKRDIELFETNCFDFAGWHAAPAKRLLELFGSREGIVTVYGDLHHAGISRNLDNGVIDAHFGPTGCAGYLRSMKHDFGRFMSGYNGESVEVVSLYHQYFESPQLIARPQRPDQRQDAQNIMEMEFDTNQPNPVLRMQIRNLIDHPMDPPRGGGMLDEPLFRTGRAAASRLPLVKTLPLADVVVYSPEGIPIRALRSLGDGSLPAAGLTEVAPDRWVLVTAQIKNRVDSQLVQTVPVP